LRGFHLQKDFKSIEKIANNIQGTDWCVGKWLISILCSTEYIPNSSVII
jgi:hypothetical protein